MWKADRASVFETFVEIRPAIRSYVVSEVVADDVAVLHANWSVVAPDGTALGEGRSTEVPKKLENGGWGYLIDCPNGLLARIGLVGPFPSPQASESFSRTGI